MHTRDPTYVRKHSAGPEQGGSKAVLCTWRAVQVCRCVLSTTQRGPGEGMQAPGGAMQVQRDRLGEGADHLKEHWEVRGHAYRSPFQDRAGKVGHQGLEDLQVTPR